jgi:arginine decarboxylase
VLVFNVLGTNEILIGQVPESVADSDPQIIKNLYETYTGVSRKNFQEAYHDVLQHKEEAITAFNLGVLDLKQRARVEQLFWATCERILKIVRDLDYVPDDLEGLEKQLTDTFYCNFSVFQSLPDNWAIDQLFPIMPIHRLLEPPTRRGTLQDVTCDSDGVIDRFVGDRTGRPSLELHALRDDDDDYVLGIFLTGAYQEILGDLHNLFGDTNAVHLRMRDDAGYEITDLVHGDTVTEVLNYVQVHASDLLATFRRKVSAAKDLTRQEANGFIADFVAGLEGYTYLEGDVPVDGGPQ